MVTVLGGLAPDTDEAMPKDLREWLQNTWRKIQDHVPGTRFNFEFWQRCTPRRSTYPACRAVIAARAQGENKDDAMTLAIQQAYYLQARNPSDRATLIALAGELGLDMHRFECDLDSLETALTLESEIALTRRIGARAFPSLILSNHDCYAQIPIDYRDPQAILDNIESRLRMV